MSTTKPKKPKKTQPRLSRKGVPVKSSAGRKPSVSKVKDKIFEALRLGNTKRTASAHGGISEITFHEWYAIGIKDIEDGIETEYSLFSIGVDESIKEMKMFVLQCWRNGMAKDWRAALAYAERTDPEFHLKQKIETTQKVEVSQKALIECPNNGRRNVKEKTDEEVK